MCSYRPMPGEICSFVVRTIPCRTSAQSSRSCAMNSAGSVNCWTSPWNVRVAGPPRPVGCVRMVFLSVLSVGLVWRRAAADRRRRESARTRSPGAAREGEGALEDPGVALVECRSGGVGVACCVSRAALLSHLVLGVLVRPRISGLYRDGLRVRVGDDVPASADARQVSFLKVRLCVLPHPTVLDRLAQEPKLPLDDGEPLAHPVGVVAGRGRENPLERALLGFQALHLAAHHHGVFAACRLTLSGL